MAVNEKSTKNPMMRNLDSSVSISFTIMISYPIPGALYSIIMIIEQNWRAWRESYICMEIANPVWEIRA